jgi:hypothetical protein
LTKILITGLLGLLASILVGVGEYLLHYDALARFADGGYQFLEGISDARSTQGHFIGVIGATLYPFGCYHIYLMLKGANNKAAFSAFLIGTFGFVVGAVWIGSRASIAALINVPQTPEIQHLITLYDLRYETLLQIIRVTTLIMSVIFIWLTLTGRSNYRKWMAFFSPIVLILGNFLIYLIAPSIGKHMMPIALNIAFFVFFVLSLWHVPYPKLQKA